jgi:hypothetical protein
MNSALRGTFPFAAIEAVLSSNDDPLLWRAALSVVADNLLQRYDRESKNKSWGMVVGASEK